MHRERCVITHDPCVSDRRLDASHDWSPADVVALLDEITAISTAPVSWTDIPMEFDASGNVKAGKPLPADFRDRAGRPMR